MQPDNRFAAIVMLCAGAAAPVVSLAQAPPAPNDVEQPKVVEQVIVTGSRVKRPEYEGNIPGVQATAEQIELRSFNNPIDVLENIPLVGRGANPNGTNGGQAASLGASFVDLLDLGTQRTLTLVNGRRYIGGNSGSLFVFGNETGTQVDVNTIPAALIERIDVLTVGGAVAYGSDAIAGVVNYIMKDDFEGMKMSARVGQTARGDGAEQSVRSTFGTNFASGRGNAFVHGEFSRIDGLQADERSFRAGNDASVTNFANGSSRNANFAAGVIDINGRNNGAFLRAADDGIPGLTGLLGPLMAANVSPGGVVFNFNAPSAQNPLPDRGVNGQIGPFGLTLTANNTQLLNGVPGACVPSPGRICNFAPTALPAGVTAAQVLSAFGVTAPAGSTAAQQSTLAINLLQANRPTPREFLAANPNTPLNAFLGTFVGAFPDIANPDPALAQILPRVAVPLRFDNAGNVEQFNVATLMADTPSTIGGAVGGDGFNNIDTTALRIDQDRAITYFGGHFDITQNLRFVSENSYAKVTSNSRRGNASNNAATSGTVENAALIVSVDNPFLSAANRAALAAAGIAKDANNPNGSFVLSRTNQDIQGNNPTETDNKTFRTVQGLEGSFDWLDRTFEWDVSLSYGRSESEIRTRNIKDVEYALALDAAVDPATGRIVCRSQLTPPVNGVVPGVSENIVRQPGADGIPTETLFTPTATAAQIAACQPLNPFGFNQLSAASREYVLARQKQENLGEQRAGQANISFPVASLPAGDIGFGAFFEYRQEEVDFQVGDLQAFGRTRTAAIAQTKGETETTEYGAELRIPIFGGDWRLPGLYALDVGGGVRRTQQDGKAPTYRALSGALVQQSAAGDPENITSINFNWAPIESLRFRGERTRAVRQPNVVELFLGGQPAFNGATDPCSNNNITSGPNPALRRSNCEAAVIAAGIAPDRAGAANFLQSFVARNLNLQGTFTGNASLSPETAESWTAGIVFTPTFLRGLRASADYISIDLDNIIFPTNQTQALNFCFDGGFPDNSASFGVNTCNLTRREAATNQAAAFQLANGFTLGFLNLAATELRALNSTVEYGFGLADLFNSSRGLGAVNLSLNFYHLFAFRESASGQFDDTTTSQGSVERPRNEATLNTGYRNGPLTVQWTWNWVDSTKVFTGGAQATADAFQSIELPSYSTHDVSAAYRLTDKYRANLTVVNLLDKNELGLNGGTRFFIDQLGRRFALTFTADFK